VEIDCRRIIVIGANHKRNDNPEGITVNHLFQKAGAARARLGEMLAACTELAAKIEANRAAAARLAGAQSNEAPIVANLARLDSAETSALLEFAASGESNMPTVDVALRAQLGQRLAEARAQADSARRAAEILDAEYQRLAGQLPAINSAVAAEIAQVVVDECGPLVDEFNSARAALEVKATRLRQAHELARDIAESAGRGALSTPAFVALDALNGRLAKAFSNPAPDDEAASHSRMAWMILASGLRTDSNTTLES